MMISSLFAELAIIAGIAGCMCLAAGAGFGILACVAYYGLGW